MRHRVLIRIMRLRTRLSSARVVSLQELAQEFGVCTRTIRRDLEALEAAGEHVPLWRTFESREAE